MRGSPRGIDENMVREGKAPSYHGAANQEENQEAIQEVIQEVIQ